MRIFIFLLLISISSPLMAYELYLVRHFEKQKDQSNPELTERGHSRAESLVNILKNKDLAIVYSTNYRRTQQTAAPVASSLNLSINEYDPRDLERFAERLKANQQNALIVGHSNTTPELISLLGGMAKKIDESEYGELFVLIMLNEQVVTQSIMVGQ